MTPNPHHDLLHLAFLSPFRISFVSFGSAQNHGFMTGDVRQKRMTAITVPECLERLEVAGGLMPEPKDDV